MKEFKAYVKEIEIIDPFEVNIEYDFDGKKEYQVELGYTFKRETEAEAEKFVAIFNKMFSDGMSDEKRIESLHVQQLLMTIDELIPASHIIRHGNSYKKLKEIYGI